MFLAALRLLLFLLAGILLNMGFLHYFSFLRPGHILSWRGPVRHIS